MKRVFKHTRVNCFVCGTPTDGKRRRGDKYYCADDFERTSVDEKLTTVKNKKHLSEHKRIFNG